MTWMATVLYLQQQRFPLHIQYCNYLNTLEEWKICSCSTCNHLAHTVVQRDAPEYIPRDSSQHWYLIWSVDGDGVQKPAGFFQYCYELTCSGISTTPPSSPFPHFCSSFASLWSSDGWWPIGVAEHGVEGAGKIVGLRAAVVVLGGGHQEGQSQEQQQQQQLEGQCCPQHALDHRAPTPWWHQPLRTGGNGSNGAVNPE